MHDAEKPHEKRRILVVDDSIDCADSLAKLLKLMGHNVHTAYSGGCVIEVVHKLKPEIVLLDISMPDMNGYEVCRQLRNQIGNELVIVAVTGFGQQEDRSRGIEVGFNDYLIKPPAFDVLHELLKKRVGA